MQLATGCLVFVRSSRAVGLAARQRCLLLGEKRLSVGESVREGPQILPLAVEIAVGGLHARLHLPNLFLQRGVSLDEQRVQSAAFRLPLLAPGIVLADALRGGGE